jgi:hypothetical protein
VAAASGDRVDRAQPGSSASEPEETAFLVTLAVFSAWSALVLAWVYIRP